LRVGVAYTVAALGLLAIGLGLWTAGRLERRLVDAQTQLLTLQPDAPLADYERIELAARLPWFARILTGIRAQRATSSYWRRDYAALTLDRDGAGLILERDPAIRLFATNAAFRNTRVDGSDRTAVERLNEIVSRYAELLRSHADFDVAYNYELVARTRDRLARPASTKDATGRQHEGFTPAPSTIHGHPGAPAAENDLGQFKIMIPQRGDERRQQPDAGTGGPKPRKG
jgi:hypothetical protein